MRHRAGTITIVTPSYNQGEFIEKTIRSVLLQHGDFLLDYIIVDGGSTDTTVSILKKYEQLLAAGALPFNCRGISFRWLSEKDRGQADAVNKGLHLAKGEICGWLNSDDIYYPDTFARVLEHFEQNPEDVLVYGDADHIERNGAYIEPYPVEDFDLQRLASICIICQPAAFFRPDAVREVGGVDSSLRTCMDYDLWIRLGKRFSGRIHHVDRLFAGSRMYPENKTLSLRELVYEESIATVTKHYGYVPESWIYLYFNEIIKGTYLKPFSGKETSLQYRILRSYHLARFFIRFCNLKTLVEANRIRMEKKRSRGQ